MKGIVQQSLPFFMLLHFSPLQTRRMGKNHEVKVNGFFPYISEVTMHIINLYINVA